VKVLVTGNAGFIGLLTAMALIERCGELGPIGLFRFHSPSLLEIERNDEMR